MVLAPTLFRAKCVEPCIFFGDFNPGHVKKVSCLCIDRTHQLRGVSNLFYVVLADWCLSHNFHSIDQGGCVSTARDLGRMSLFQATRIVMTGLDMEKATSLGTLLFSVHTSTQESWANVNPNTREDRLELSRPCSTFRGISFTSQSVHCNRPDHDRRVKTYMLALTWTVRKNASYEGSYKQYEQFMKTLMLVVLNI